MGVVVTQIKQIGERLERRKQQRQQQQQQQMLVESITEGAPEGDDNDEPDFDIATVCELLNRPREVSYP